MSDRRRENASSPAPKQRCAPASLSPTSCRRSARSAAPRSAARWFAPARRMSCRYARAARSWWWVCPSLGGSFAIFADGRRRIEDSSLSSFVLRLPSNLWQRSLQELDCTPPGQLGCLGVVLGPIRLEKPVLRAGVAIERCGPAGGAQLSLELAHAVERLPLIMLAEMTKIGRSRFCEIL